jgi:CheY-like chemotaxis protein
MARVQLRCQTCGARTETDIGATEERNLAAQGFLTRYCRRCAGQARWTRQESTVSSFRSEYLTPPPERAPSILLIDDDDSILAIVQKALSQEGYEVETANSGRRAIEVITRGDYDLILSDIRMPDFDGKQLFEFLDKNLAEYRTRVIFLTGDAGNPDTSQFLRDTQCPYLSKPVDIPALLELVNRRLAAR